MKSQGLMERKAKLQEEVSKLSQEIVQLTANLDEQGLAKFVATGELKTDTEYKLPKLQARLLYLQRLGKGLNAEISKARKSEREAEASRLQRQMDRMRRDHDKLTEKQHQLHLQEDKLIKQGRALTAQIEELKQHLGTFTRTDETKPMGLKQVEKFIQENYVADPQELRDLVKETKEGNRALLQPGNPVMPVGLKRRDIITGWMITLEKDSGKILKTKELTRSVGLVSGSPMAMEVI